MEPSGIQGRALETKLAHDPTFCACYPHPKFPTLSITGDTCSLNCKHCNRRYLRHMLPCLTPDVLFTTCLNLASNGARGVLLSGGYNGEGYVPFEPFLDAIERVKRETGLFISAHTGLVPGWLAQELGKTGVDLVDFDLIGDDETVELVMGIDRSVEDYQRAMKALERSLPNVVPHICIGLHAGELRGEFRALEMLSEFEISGLVFLALVPTPGTPFEKVESPSPSVVGEVIARARLSFPEIPLALGCMRPRSRDRVEFELQAVRSGVDRMVAPAADTIKEVKRRGIGVKRVDACCSLPVSDLISFMKPNFNGG